MCWSVVLSTLAERMVGSVRRLEQVSKEGGMDYSVTEGIANVVHELSCLECSSPPFSLVFWNLPWKSAQDVVKEQAVFIW